MTVSNGQPARLATRKGELWSRLSLAAIVLIAAGLRFPLLGTNPVGFFCDEASVGYDALSLLETGRDQYGRLLPLFARSFGDWDEAFYRYLSIPWVALFGPTIAATRATAALFGVATVVAIFMLARGWFGTRAALLAAAMLAISPWHVQFSRVAFRAILLPLFFVLGLYFWTQAKERSRLLLASAACFALALWTYSPARLVVPVFGVLLLALSGFARRREALPWALAGVALFGTALVGLGLFWITPEGMARAQVSLQGGAANFFSNYASYFGLRFLFLEGDPNPRHGIEGWGTVHSFEALSLIAGAVVLGLRRKTEHLLLAAWLMLAPIPAALTEPSHALRAILMAPALAVVSGLGLEALALRLRAGLVRHLGIGLAAGVAVGSTASFSRAYFRDYPAYSAMAWQAGFEQLIDELGQDSRPCRVLSNRLGQPHIFALFFGRIPPEHYQARPIQTLSQSQWLYEYEIDGWRIAPMQKAVVASRECVFGGLPKEAEIARTVVPGYRELKTIRGPQGEALFQIFAFDQRVSDGPSH